MKIQQAGGRWCDPGKTVEPVMKDTENSEELAYDRKVPLGIERASTMISVPVVESCMLGGLIQLRGNRMQPKKETKGSLGSGLGSGGNKEIVKPALPPALPLPGTACQFWPQCPASQPQPVTVQK